MILGGTTCYLSQGTYVTSFAFDDTTPTGSTVVELTNNTAVQLEWVNIEIQPKLVNDSAWVRFSVWRQGETLATRKEIISFDVKCLSALQCQYFDFNLHHFILDEDQNIVFSAVGSDFLKGKVTIGYKEVNEDAEQITVKKCDIWDWLLGRCD